MPAAPVFYLFLCGIFLLGHYPVGHRRPAHAALLYEEGRWKYVPQFHCASDGGHRLQDCAGGSGSRDFGLLVSSAADIAGELFLAVSAGAVAECHRGDCAVSGHVFSGNHRKHCEGRREASCEVSSDETGGEPSEKDRRVYRGVPAGTGIFQKE